MTHPIHRGAGLQPTQRLSPTGPAAQHHGSFQDALQRTTTPLPEGPSLARTSSDLLRRVAAGERYMDSVVRQGLNGRAFTNEELLAVQARIYRYTQETELVAKVVDKGTGALKTILQSGNG